MKPHVFGKSKPMIKSGVQNIFCLLRIPVNFYLEAYFLLKR